jgi:hypothetical protein
MKRLVFSQPRPCLQREQPEGQVGEGQPQAEAPVRCRATNLDAHRTAPYRWGAARRSAVSMLTLSRVAVSRTSSPALS